MIYLKVILTSFLSIFALFFLAKCLGHRQVSEMSIFDYINGITIGSIAAEMAISTQMKEFIKALIAMIVYTACSFFVSYLCNKSIKFRRFSNGTSIILYDNGKLYKQNLSKGKIDINELLMQCRLSGYFDLNQLKTVILEPNGKISFLPKSIDRPVTPSDLNLAVKSDDINPCVIIDGKILTQNLNSLGLNEQFLKNRLKELGFNSFDDVFLATVDTQKNVTAYSKYEEMTKKDYFA